MVRALKFKWKRNQLKSQPGNSGYFYKSAVHNPPTIILSLRRRTKSIEKHDIMKS